MVGIGMQRSPRRGPKPIPAQEALGSDFPSSKSEAEPATGSYFCGHMVKQIQQKNESSYKDWGLGVHPPGGRAGNA